MVTAMVTVSVNMILMSFIVKGNKSNWIRLFFKCLWLWQYTGFSILRTVSKQNIRWLFIKQRHARSVHFKDFSLLFLARTCADAPVSKNPVNGVTATTQKAWKLKIISPSLYTQLHCSSLVNLWRRIVPVYTVSRFGSVWIVQAFLQRTSPNVTDSSPAIELLCSEPVEISWASHKKQNSEH